MFSTYFYALYSRSGTYEECLRRRDRHCRLFHWMLRPDERPELFTVKIDGHDSDPLEADRYSDDPCYIPVLDETSSSSGVDLLERRKLEAKRRKKTKKRYKQREPKRSDDEKTFSYNKHILRMIPSSKKTFLTDSFLFDLSDRGRKKNRRQETSSEGSSDDMFEPRDVVKYVEESEREENRKHDKSVVRRVPNVKAKPKDVIRYVSKGDQAKKLDAKRLFDICGPKGAPLAKQKPRTAERTLLPKHDIKKLPKTPRQVVF